MKDIKDVQYGIPRTGGPDQLPPPLIWRPGFGTLPGHETMEFPFEIPTAEFNPQILIEDGKLAPLGTTGVITGEVRDDRAEKVSLTVTAPTVNGFYITGDSEYKISDSQIDMSGDCVNDFAGNGAAVQVMKNAKTVVENSRIHTAGVLRCCLVADEFSTLEVNNCELICDGGTPAPDNPGWMIPAGPGMIKAPDVMKCAGHSRLSLTVGNAHAYYNNCTIISDGWAALSTDASWGDTYLRANNCDITLKNDGYATFSDEGAVVEFNDCRIQSPAHCAMICGKASVEMNRCKVRTGKNVAWIFAIMGPNGSQIGDLKMQDCEIETGEESILVCGENAYIDVRGCTLKSKTGVILHGKDNYVDPMATKINPGEALYGIKAVFSDMQLEGDIIHEDPDRAMAVVLSHVQYKGAVNGATLQLDPSSTWFSTSDSCVKLTPYTDINRIDAPEGVTITIQCRDMEEYNGKVLPSGGTIIVK